MSIVICMLRMYVITRFVFTLPFQIFRFSSVDNIAKSRSRTQLICTSIEFGIIGEGSQILTNQKRENSAFSILIGRNLRPFPMLPYSIETLLTPSF